MINDKQIDYLLTVVEEGNITKAAKKLYLSQPALSMMIIAIEKEIGIPLFNREFSPLQLTLAGEKYIEACLKVRQIRDDLLKEIGDLAGGEQGRITIGMSLHLSIFTAHLLIPAFRSRYPNYEIAIVEGSVGQLSQMVATGQIDFAIVYEKSGYDLHYEKIIGEEIYLVAPPAYLSTLDQYSPWVNKKEIYIKEIQDYPFILLKKGHGLRNVADQVFHQFNISPKIIFETDSIEVAHRLAKSDLGFTFISTLSILPGDSGANGVYFPVKSFTSHRQLFLCYRKDTYQSKAIKGFMEVVMGLFRGER